MQTQASHNGKPENGSQSRCQHHACDEFPNRPALGDTGNERSHKWSPCNPPRPVEHSPCSNPVIVTVIVNHEAVPKKVLQILPQSVCQVVKNLKFWPYQKCNSDQANGNI